MSKEKLLKILRKPVVQHPLGAKYKEINSSKIFCTSLQVQLIMNCSFMFKRLQICCPPFSNNDQNVFQRHISNHQPDRPAAVMCSRNTRSTRLDQTSEIGWKCQPSLQQLETPFFLCYKQWMWKLVSRSTMKTVAQRCRFKQWVAVQQVSAAGAEFSCTELALIVLPDSTIVMVMLTNYVVQKNPGFFLFSLNAFLYSKFTFFCYCNQNCHL